MSKRRCSECAFWEARAVDYDGHEDDWEGECRRFPPVLDVHYLKTVDTSIGGSEARSEAWQQPLTSGGDWCGEFAQKERGAETC